MSALRAVFSSVVRSSNVPRRNYGQFIGSGISGMARNKMSKFKRMQLVTLLYIWWFPYPLWVYWNMDYYRSLNQSDLD